MTDPALDDREIWDFRRPALTTEQILERAKREHDNRLRWGYVKPVVCEPCLRSLHQTCVMPCTCEHRRRQDDLPAVQ